MTITRPTQLDLVLDKVIDDVERATVLAQHAVSAAEDLQRLLDVARSEVIPAGYTPEDWAAFGSGIMAQLKAELGNALAGHRISEPHDCFLMNCRDLGDEVRQLTERLVIASMRPVVHTYAGEGLTACGLEVVGPCPDCETRG